MKGGNSGVIPSLLIAVLARRLSTSLFPCTSAVNVPIDPGCICELTGTVLGSSSSDARSIKLCFDSASLDCLTRDHMPLIHAESSKSDRAALLALFESTNRHGWKISTFWGTGTDIAFWHGVEVDCEGHVDVLHLYDNNLSGECLCRSGSCSVRKPQNSRAQVRFTNHSTF